MKYKISKGIKKALKYSCIFGLPFLAAQIITANPQLNTLTVGQVIDQIISKLVPTGAGITIGALLTFGINFLKVWGSNIDDK